MASLDHEAYSTDCERRRLRQIIRARFPCPFCNVEAGEKCIGVRGQKRTAMHQERWDLYRERRDAPNIH